MNRLGQRGENLCGSLGMRDASRWLVGEKAFWSPAMFSGSGDVWARGAGARRRVAVVDVEARPCFPCFPNGVTVCEGSVP